MADTKVVPQSGKAASQNSDTAPAKKGEPVKAVSGKEEKKIGGKTEKKVKQVNPFSFTDPLQVRVVNSIMKKGKRQTAQKNIEKQTFE